MADYTVELENLAHALRHHIRVSLTACPRVLYWSRTYARHRATRRCRTAKGCLWFTLFGAFYVAWWVYPRSLPYIFAISTCIFILEYALFISILLFVVRALESTLTLAVQPKIARNVLHVEQRHSLPPTAPESISVFIAPPSTPQTEGPTLAILPEAHRIPDFVGLPLILESRESPTCTFSADGFWM
jgi:hypothetical protein